MSRAPFRFEKLEVWQQARLFNREISRLTRGFPAFEQFALTSQMRRAAVSVCSNIAEGAGRNSDRDFAHFLEQAYGSLMEVASQLFLALDESYVTPQEHERLLDLAQTLAAKLGALNRSLQISTTKVNVAPRK